MEEKEAQPATEVEAGMSSVEEDTPKEETSTRGHNHARDDQVHSNTDGSE